MSVRRSVMHGELAAWRTERHPVGPCLSNCTAAERTPVRVPPRCQSSIPFMFQALAAPSRCGAGGTVR